MQYYGDTQKDKDEALEKALKIFKKIVANEGIMQEIKDRATFRSPSKKKHDHMREVIHKRKLKEEKRKQNY